MDKFPDTIRKITEERVCHKCPVLGGRGGGCYKGCLLIREVMGRIEGRKG